ncbi:MAG: DNA-binding protein WhiA, partial [Oscillospiraceae bacterium]|nr:DNA-binding protein WhiA [Oscillospiraceae bacterium]
MSFSFDAKEEICRQKLERRCCAVAESCGVLLYCHTFSSELIRISTSNAPFAARLPKLFRKAFGLSFDVLPPDSSAGRRSLLITDPEKIDVIFQAFGGDRAATVSHHVNFAILEEECCRISFLRGAFLAGGSVTDPERRFHLELATSHQSVARETVSLMQELGFSPRLSQRSGNALLYFKQSDAIADFLTTIGASVPSMNVLTAKVEKEMRNTVTRQINCDSANADKTVSAAQEQILAIRRYSARYGLDTLPEPLKDAALLRITNPAASLSDLAKLSNPPVTKSCLSHRLRKIA